MSFPEKKCKVKCKRNNFKLSLNLKVLADRNYDLALLARDTNDPQLKLLLKDRQRQFRKLLAEEKNLKIAEEVQRSSCVQRAVWNVVRRETRESGPQSSIPPIKSDSASVLTPGQIAEQFIACFSNNLLLDQSSHSLPSSITSVHFPVGRSLFFFPTSSSEIECTIHSLKSKTSFGTDGISSCLLKKIYKSFLDPLVYLFNESLSTGIFPDVYKISKLVPVFKKGDKSSVDNYRPISLLCTLSKVLEKIVYKRLLDHLNKFHILIPNQYGFRVGRSTSQAIIEFTNQVISCLDRREPALAVFCDLSKAFDRVDHAILGRKLEAFGVRGIPLNWFSSYLSGRKQFVEVSGTRSECVDVVCGVPQGSILGPLLFLVYINDLSINLSLANTILFADDTTLLFGGSRGNLMDRVSASIVSLKGWLLQNNLILNSNKTVFVNFQTKNKPSLPKSFDLDEFKIKESSSVNFLGLNIDNTLSWLPHISILCKKLSRTSFALRTLNPLLSLESLLWVYHGCFSSQMSYGVEVWGGSPHAHRVFVEQKRAVRIIKGLPPLSSCRGVFKDLNILTLPSLYMLKAIVITVSNCSQLPTVGSNHRFPTRHGADLRTPRHRLALFERDVVCAGAMLFNKLPVKLKLAVECKNTFKRLLKYFFIQNEFYSVKEFLSA